MRRVIQAECEGQIVNMDGTWRIGLRVPGVPACLYFLLGENAKVHDYGAIKSESKSQLRPLFMRCAVLKFGAKQTVVPLSKAMIDGYFLFIGY